MDPIDVGSAVTPKNGRFAGRPMVVLSIRDGYAEVSDGRRRPIEKPKRKKLCHLCLLSPGAPRLAVDAELTNGKVRRHISAHRASDHIPDNMKHDSK